MGFWIRPNFTNLEVLSSGFRWQACNWEHPSSYQETTPTNLKTALILWKLHVQLTNMLLKMGSSSPHFRGEHLQHISETTTKTSMNFISILVSPFPQSPSAKCPSDGYAPKSHVNAPIIFQHLQVALLQPLFWGGTAFCVMAARTARRKALRNEDDIYEDVFFFSCYLKSCWFSSCPLLLRNPFPCNGWFCTQNHCMPNFQQTFFWSVSSENGIWMIHSLPSLCLQNRLRWHEIAQLGLLLIETHRSMHVAIFCPCHLSISATTRSYRQEGTPFGRANAAVSNSWGRFQSMCSDSLATQFRGRHPSLKDPVCFIESSMKGHPKNMKTIPWNACVFGSWPLRFHVDSSCRGPIVLQVLISFRLKGLDLLPFPSFNLTWNPKNPGKGRVLYIYIHIYIYIYIYTYIYIHIYIYLLVRPQNENYLSCSGWEELLQLSLETLETQSSRIETVKKRWCFSPLRRHESLVTWRFTWCQSVIIFLEAWQSRDGKRFFSPKMMTRDLCDKGGSKGNCHLRLSPIIVLDLTSKFWRWKTVVAVSNMGTYVTSFDPYIW